MDAEEKDNPRRNIPVQAIIPSSGSRLLPADMVTLLHLVAI